VTRIVVILALVAMLCGIACGQARTAEEFWPEVDAHFQFAQTWRVLGFAGSERGEEIGYRQFHAGVGMAHQWKRISKPHPENINPDKEHIFVLGGGYEYLRTVLGKTKTENRAVLEAMPGFRPFSRLLVRDRNRVEFRWVAGAYSTRYRNEVYAAYDVSIHKFRFNPYASVEAFYNGTTSSWSQEQYTAGIEWPYKRRLMVNTYYLRQNCPICGSAHLNVGGLKVNLYF
jgi:uncharacterized protein DUF2490